jgi:hypothetical protein
MYVVKFHGAGQGPRVLVTEVVVGELARALGLPVPELVVIDVDPRLASAEPDQEVQDLLRASPGLNLGLDYLPGSLGFEPSVDRIGAELAAQVLWLDGLTDNVDRTWRNPNLLVWHRTLWAIDHGAALVFQHAWPAPEVWAARRYDLSEHVLLPVVSTLADADLARLDAELAAVVPDLLPEVLDLVPGAWLTGMNAAVGDPRDADGWRARYVDMLTLRAGGNRPWFTVRADRMVGR